MKKAGESGMVGARRGDRESLPSVLIVGSTQGAYGGIEAFMLAIASQVAACGRFHVRLLFKLVKGAVVRESLRVAAAGTGLPVEFASRGSLSVLRAVAAADVVHAQNAPPDLCFPARLLGKPLILTIHNRFTATGLRGAVWKSGAAVGTRRLYNSRFVQSSWEGTRLRKHSSVVHTNSELELAPAPMEGRRGFCFIGRLIENKGADLLLEAYAAAGLDARQWPLTFMGEGPLRERLEARSVALGLNGVRFLGFVSTALKFSELRASKWLVAAPNTNEDMGLTPLEARSQAIPCIVSNDGGLPEVAGKDALVCEKGSVRDLTRVLLKAAALEESAYRQIAQQSFESLAADLPGAYFYSELYASILGGKF